ncbi:hypothetical protein P168DRAFT_61671 [Aspergillus campestris IBT 28561]|uniref:Uncharacterized protein n=1 Tax=Aspergillus campestris (strain IBT 28561) TaxID=1392248 RepID=A0A2I1CUJ7_ASPC2|nr:uncharacterized protein P168DRAFT_61671 [Aspergillus campestris IBT 28561]PKY01287.1 hypothetical protein P168DRAFT_61671 [Aspergillus campestris IBT 28561]
MVFIALHSRRSAFDLWFLSPRSFLQCSSIWISQDCPRRRVFGPFFFLSFLPPLSSVEPIVVVTGASYFLGMGWYCIYGWVDCKFVVGSAACFLSFLPLRRMEIDGFS